MDVYAGPELGPLAGLMVGPEQGGWQVEEITVVSSRTGHVDRYLVFLKLPWRYQDSKYLHIGITLPFVHDMVSDCRAAELYVGVVTVCSIS